MTRALLPSLLALALAACARDNAPDASTTPVAPATPAAVTAAATDAPALEGYHWQLSSAADAQGRRIDTLFARDDKPVQLEFGEGRIGIANTCNHMGGSYAASGDTLTVGRLVSTMMACTDNALMALDREVGQRLEGPLAYALQAGGMPQLTLTTAGGDVLTFLGKPTAQTRYGGPGERVFLEVAAETKPCSHPLIPDKQCLQVREIRYDENGAKIGEPGQFQHFYDEIEGYAHEPGVRHVLRVDRYTVRNPPADASAHAYVLDRVVESETVRP